MKNNIKYLKASLIVLFFILNSTTLTYGQEVECGTIISPEAATILDGPRSSFKRGLLEFEMSDFLEENREIYRIPIQAHVIRKSDGSGGITTTEIEESIARANDDYESMNMQFFLCGTNYIDNSEYYNATISPFSPIE